MPVHFFSKFLFTVGALFPLSLFAGGDCATATNLTLEPWSLPTYTCTSTITETFANSCAGGGFADSRPTCTAAATCSEQLWFRFDAGDPTSQYDVFFTVTADFSGTGASELRYFVLYSEARDSGNGDPCTWVTGTTAPLTHRYSGTGCVSVPDGISQFTIESDGMDGDGTYFVLFERVTGNGGSVSICAKSHPTNSPQAAPANDRCTNSTGLALGSGIDAAYLTGGSGLWADAIGGSTQYATKERRTAECNLAGSTEDHYFTQDFTGCYTNWNIGDQVSFGFLLGNTVDYLENTVYYTATIPANTPGGTNWFLHIGALDCPTTTGTDGIQLMIASTLDCNNAANTTIVQSDSAFVSGLYPTADLSMGPYGLNPGQTYYIIVDGTRGAGCDFSMLLSPAAINPVLPVTLDAIAVNNQGTENILEWETSSESGSAYFEVQRATDDTKFKEIGQVQARVTSSISQQYQFVDTNAPLGKAYYRLKPVDIDGRHALSQVVHTFRDLSGFEWHSLAPVPLRDQVSLRLTASETAQAVITIRDVAGRAVQNQSFLALQGLQEQQMDVSALSAGIYFVELQVGGQRQIQKVLKQ